MKSIVILLAVGLLGAQIAQADQALLRFRMSPGFMPKPRSVTVTVTDKGRIIRETQSSVEPKKTLERLGTISLARIAVIKNAVEAFDQKNLVDLQQGEPMCTDAPTFETSVFQASGEIVVIHRRAGCHEFSMSDRNSYSVTDLMDGLVKLGEITDAE